MTRTEREVTIYALCDPDPPHAVRYVGQTRLTPKRRYYFHSISPASAVCAWIMRLHALGKDALICVLDRIPAAQADERERFHITSLWDAGAPLVNKHNLPGTTPRRQGTRPVESVGLPRAPRQQNITIRLAPDDDMRLKEIASTKRIPVAILVRNWIGEQIEKHQTEQAREESHRDVPR